MSFLTSLLTLLKANPSLKYGLLLFSYMSLVRHLRYRRINNLLRKYPDPTLPLRDLNVAREVTTATSGYDFPFVNVISLEFALFKTYAIPSISKILAATKQFATQCPKRADDTGLILCEMTETYKRQEYRRMTEGKEDLDEDLTDAKRERLALEKLNLIHGHYPIRQEDYLYTLALFILEPVSWINRLEWRQITDLEKNNYERENMVYAPSNVAIAQATTSLLLSKSPKVIHPLGRHIVSSLLTDRLRTAFAIPNPPRGLTTFILGVFKLRRFFIQYLLLPKWYPNFRTALRANDEGKFVPRWNKYAPVYPNGYHIEDLGPNKFLGKCPV
ncbi:hypothetical protein F5H01DRAFT_289299, partial [Linnemannia elongata]